jgi:hypothetical protein
MSQDFLNIPDEHFDNSKIDDWLWCRRIYYFKWVLKIESVYDNVDLLFGDYFHQGIKVYWVNQADGIPTAIQLAITEFMTKMIGLEPKGAKDIHNGVDILREFLSSHRVVGKLKTAEKRVHKRLGRFTFFGTADLVTELSDGTLILWDWKTFGRKLANLFVVWESIRRQFMGYQWLVDAQKVVVVGFHIIVDDKKQRIYYQNCYYTPVQIEIWKASTIMFMEEIYGATQRGKQALANGGRDDYTLDACFPAAGPKCAMMGCEFVHLCSKGVPLREIYEEGVDTLYRRKTR